VILPTDAEFKPTGQSPLVSHEAFLRTTCPTCGGPARRETDTMDTFVDSSWYWFRYTSPGFDEGPFEPAKVAKWCPVDLYCGGVEHAILHLLYARFWTKVSRDMGLIDHGEPFLRLRNQGMILSEEGVKMSKSRGTQIDPAAIVAAHGTDALRLHLMYLGPWDQGGPWNDQGITGMEGFIRRAFRLVAEWDAASAKESVAADGEEHELRRQTHQAIQRATVDLEAFRFNTAVAALIEFTNWLTKRRDEPIARTAAWREALETLTLLMAPMTPYVAEEMWERLGKPYSVHQQAWPSFDPGLAKADEVEIVVQVNGKVRDRLVVPSDVTEARATELALASPRVQDQLGGKPPAKVVYVPGKLVSIVAGR
jgi:leucyl-tRNA synthetase